MTLRKRVEALADRIPIPEEERRMILCWKSEEGRLTKVSDSHPHLPDGAVYHADMTVREEVPHD